jgi:uncharacterized protein
MIKDKIEELVKEACRSDSVFGYTAWTHHIRCVVKYSHLMAQILGADEEVVEISALLHDIAKIQDRKLWDEHHIHGAQSAEKALCELRYPSDRIDQVKDCILSHRGSVNIPREIVQAKCVAYGDAMAHFNFLAVMFRIALVLKKMNVQDAN